MNSKSKLWCFTWKIGETFYILSLETLAVLWVWSQWDFPFKYKAFYFSWMTFLLSLKNNRWMQNTLRFNHQLIGTGLIKALTICSHPMVCWVSRLNRKHSVKVLTLSTQWRWSSATSIARSPTSNNFKLKIMFTKAHKGRRVN